LGREGAAFGRGGHAPDAPPPKAAAASAHSLRKRKDLEPAEDAGAGGSGDEGGEGAVASFNELDCRVGVVTKAWRHEASAKLMCEEIDVGEGAPRPIASGIQAHYTPEEFTGKRVVVVCNLKAAKLGGYTSNGMVLCASWTDPATGATRVRLVEPPPDAPVGERVVWSGGPVTPPASAAQVKKRKVFEAVAERLALVDGGVAAFAGAPLVAVDTKGACVVAGGPPGARVS